MELKISSKVSRDSSQLPATQILCKPIELLQLLKYLETALNKIYLRVYCRNYYD